MFRGNFGRSQQNLKLFSEVRDQSLQIHRWQFNKQGNSALRVTLGDARWKISVPTFPEVHTEPLTRFPHKCSPEGLSTLWSQGYGYGNSRRDIPSRDRTELVPGAGSPAHQWPHPLGDLLQQWRLFFAQSYNLWRLLFVSQVSQIDQRKSLLINLMEFWTCPHWAPSRFLLEHNVSCSPWTFLVPALKLPLSPKSPFFFFKNVM